MNIAGCTKVLTDAEIDLIHKAVLDILADPGVRIENKVILDRLAARGADINTHDMRAAFSPAWVERFIADSDIFDWSVVASVSALKRFARGCTIDADTLAVDAVREVGPGNLFTGHLHTAQHFREELWEPSLWTREMYTGWQANDRRIDMEKARDIYSEIMARPDLEPGLSSATDRELGNIIKKAEADLGA